MATSIRLEATPVVVDGHKGVGDRRAYADLLVVFGRAGGGGAIAVVPTSAPVAWSWPG